MRADPTNHLSADVVLEVRPATRNLDVDRVGEHLMIFDDRVELRDRYGRVVRSIAVNAVSGVRTRRRLGSVSVSIDGGAQGQISMRGVHPDQAERLQQLLGRVPIPSHPDVDDDRLPSHAEVLRQLDALARIGLFDQRELAEKRALLARRGISLGRR
jgi:hypothetical protein